MNPSVRSVRFANGEFQVTDGQKYRVEAAEIIHDEDWKTALALGKKGTPIGTQGRMQPIVNFYGRWASVFWDDGGHDYCDFSRLKMLGD